MPEYYVTGHKFETSDAGDRGPKSRTFVIRADYYKQADSGNYHFYNRSRNSLVASVNTREVFAIAEKDAFLADWIDNIYNGNEEEAKEAAEEEDECDGTCSCSETAPAQPEPPVLYQIERWKDKYGDKWWGFHTDKGFVHFSTKARAEDGLLYHIAHLPRAWAWAYLNLTGATRLED